MNPVSGRVYVVYRRSASVSVIDGATRRVITRIPVGIDPVAVDVNLDTNAVYMVNRRSADVSVIHGGATK